MVKKRKANGNVLKKCENVFAACVILACLYTIIITVNSSGQRKNASRARSVLKLAKENFMMAIRKGKIEKLATTTRRMDETDVNDANVALGDMTETWFRSRYIESFRPKQNHRILDDKEIVLNKDICGSSSVDILIYFHSLWSNFNRRNELRETWANTKLFKDINIRTVFILGKPETKPDQIKINNENLVHHDIVQGNFVDSFKNLTMKSILAMKWINNYCSQAKYIVKSDDDMFFNIFAAIEYLISQIHEKDKVIMCHLKENNTSQIMRDPKDKWYVPKEIFPGRTHYPKFCSGYIVIFTGDLIPLLYRASFAAPYFSVDDAYLFGLLLGKVQGVEYISIQEHMTLNQKAALDEYQGNGPLVNVAASAWGEGSMVKFWQKTLSKLTEWGKEHATITQIKDYKK